MRAGLRLILLLCAAAPAQALAQKTVDVRLGDWRASYSLYSSPAAVCEAEPQWLADELDSVNALLDGFLALGTTRNNAWKESQLPLLVEAARVLPPMLEAHAATLNGLESCEVRKTRLFPGLLERGQKLVKEARNEVGQLGDLVRFTRHHVVLDKWEQERVKAQAAARANCSKSSAKPVIYFAYEDEFSTRRWLFCDDSTVIAPPGKTWERDPADPKKATLFIQTARLHADGQMLKAPKP
jgi:hypothetical protein